jgi:hypothetical protein
LFFAHAAIPRPAPREIAAALIVTFALIGHPIFRPDLFRAFVRFAFSKHKIKGRAFARPMYRS